MRRCLMMLLMCGVAWLVASPPLLGQMLSGVAVVDITPPVPYRMSGYFQERISTGIKDRLFAKALCWRQADEQACLVFCDLIGMAPEVCAAARQQASQRTGIPAANIAIMATHSHTGPLYFGALRKHFHERMEAAQGADLYERLDYARQLTEKLVGMIGQAQAACQPVQLRAGYLEESRLSFNRRFHMKNGEVRFNPGQRNPDIVRAAGPIDPQIGIVALCRSDRSQPTAAMISFALHLDTVGGTEYSADFPYHMQQRLRVSLGDDFTALFGAGTCGDINHIDVTVQDRRSAGQIGDMLGDTILAGFERLQPVAAPTLAARSTIVDAPLQHYSAVEVQQARENMNLVGTSQLSFLDQVQAYKIMALQERPGNTAPLEVQAFRLSNDVAIVTLPGEVFVELGMQIKASSPFAITLVMELANDAPGYIPTRKAFAEGSYETVNSRVTSGGGELMATAAIELLHQLKP